MRGCVCASVYPSIDPSTIRYTYPPAPNHPYHTHLQGGHGGAGGKRRGGGGEAVAGPGEALVVHHLLTFWNE